MLCTSERQIVSALRARRLAPLSAAMLANMVIVATGYTLSMGAAPLMHSPARACAPLMADVVSENPWNDPREGKPFGEADGPNRPIGKVRGAVASYQPRGITDASVIKPQYIETDDEPW